jgi:flagellar hook-associated protein 1 FlgK
MSTGIFSIGNSALAAAYTALRTAGNNIANVNTPGYSRQTVVTVPQVGTFLGGSYVGQGVAVADVRRVYSDFLTSQAHQAQSTASQSETRYTQLSQVANLFADPTTGIGATLDGFYRAVQDLTQRPADPAVRQQVISAGSLLAQRFNDVGDRLQEFRTSTDRQLRLEADSINLLAQEVADLNDKISLARGAGRSPNDLLDRRDNAIRRLNESIRVTVVEQDDGAANLFLGNGQPLVVGNRASSVGVQTDPLDPQNMQIGVRSGNTLIPVDARSVGGGRVGGLLQFRGEDLPMVENELGRLAIALTQTFNEQHKLGNDRNGAPGQDFFRPIPLLAFAAGTNGNPAPAVSAQVVDPAALVASDYRIDYTAGSYVLTRESDGQQWTSATPGFTQDGLQIDIANTTPAPANGDVFLVRPLRNATREFGVLVSQPSQVAAANPVQVSMPATNIGSLVVDDLGVVAGAPPAPLRNPALTNAVSLVFTGSSAYEIRNTATNAVLTTGSFTSGTPIQFNGWSLTLRGNPSAGDALNIAANVGGIGDNRNAIKLSQLGSRPLIDGGQLSAAFAGIVARVGGETRGAEVFNAAQTMMRDDALAAESALAGVNLDEEASRLIQFQQQYQAAAKVIATGKTIFEEILSLGR